eukprot:15364670-Ditylum_brightwellii.AAC.1
MDNDWQHDGQVWASPCSKVVPLLHFACWALGWDTARERSCRELLSPLSLSGEEDGECGIGKKNCWMADGLPEQSNRGGKEGEQGRSSIQHSLLAVCTVVYPHKWIAAEKNNCIVVHHSSATFVAPPVFCLLENREP